MYIGKVFVQYVHINSLAPGRYWYNLHLIIFKLISGIGMFSISCEIALRWMLQDVTDD